MRRALGGLRSLPGQSHRLAISKVGGGVLGVGEGRQLRSSSRWAHHDIGNPEQEQAQAGQPHRWQWGQERKPASATELSEHMQMQQPQWEEGHDQQPHEQRDQQEGQQQRDDKQVEEGSKPNPFSNWLNILLASYFFSKFFLPSDKPSSGSLDKDHDDDGDDVASGLRQGSKQPSSGLLETSLFHDPYDPDQIRKRRGRVVTPELIEELLNGVRNKAFDQFSPRLLPGSWEREITELFFAGAAAVDPYRVIRNHIEESVLPPEPESSFWGSSQRKKIRVKESKGGL